LRIQNLFHFILLPSFYKVRWRFGKVGSFWVFVIFAQLIDMKHGMNVPVRGKLEAIRKIREFLDDLKGSVSPFG